MSMKSFAVLKIAVLAGLEQLTRDVYGTPLTRKRVLIRVGNRSKLIQGCSYVIIEL